eukprot:Pgem_evm1s9518
MKDNNNINTSNLKCSSIPKSNRNWSVEQTCICPLINNPLIEVRETKADNTKSANPTYSHGPV